MPRDFDYPQNLGAETGRRIDNLVNTSITAKGDKARRASHDLGELISKSRALEPFILGTYRYLIAMSGGTTPKEIRNAGEALEHLIDNVVRIHASSGPTTVTLDPATLRLIDGIDRVGEDLNARPLHSSRLPPAFDDLRSKFTSQIRNAAQGGASRMEISFAMKSGDMSREEKDKRLAEYNRWALELASFTTGEARLKGDFIGYRDKAIDQLRIEPDSSFIGHGHGRILDLEHGSDMSLSKLETLEDPTDLQAFNQIITYFTATNNSTNINHQIILGDLLLEQTYYVGSKGRQVYRNEKLLGNIAKWQEQLVTYAALGSPDEKTEQAVVNLLRSFDRGQAIKFILMAFTSWSIHPHQLHPDDADNPYERNSSSHPLLDRAIDWYLESHPDKTSGFVHSDKVGRDYLLGVGATQLKARLTQLALGDKFADGFDSLRKIFEESSHEDQNLEAVIDSLDFNGGGEFVDRLKSQSGQIREITLECWNSIFEGAGPRFLPMQDGVEVIEFSEGSLPDIIGIESLAVKRAGVLPDWSISLSFRLKDTFLSITGELNNSGVFITNPRITETIPHFTDLLAYISVASFHDLVVQREAEEKKRKSRKSSVPKQTAHIGDEGLIETQDGMIPRRQYSKSLVEDVYTITRTKPRKVDLHRMQLRGAGAYSEAVANYTITRDNGSPIDEAKRELVEARTKAYNISSEKKSKVPAKYELQKLTDPVTGEERYLQTWVVDHTVPKPTPEELASPKLLFRRYYKGSSSLAFLDQLKPWIVGE